MEERAHRSEKIAELFRREVSRFIKETVDTPADIFITVSKVVPSGNRQLADVFLTIFPFERSEETVELVQKHVSKIQHALNKELKMRPVPKIRFVLDESEEKARKILDILSES